MASKSKKSSTTLLWIMFVAIGAFFVFCPKNDSSQHMAGATANQKEASAQEETPINFTLPLYTKGSALVCPLAAALDNREGHGLKAAIDAHLSIFGHDESVKNSGCQEWREGIPVSLTDEGVKQALRWETEKMCGMIDFDSGMIFSCDLRNALGAENDQKILERGEQEIVEALKDPDKVRLMECIGVNPQKVKPAGWTAPTEEECSALKQKLGLRPN